MYSFQTRIRYSELNAEGYLKLESLLDYFQDCSTFQSEDLGLGVEFLRKQHLVWVLSSWQIIVNRYPKLGERVSVGTQPYDFKGFMGFRNFVMDDEAGNRIACANSVWSLIDTENAHPVRASEEMHEKYVIFPKIEMDYAPRKIKVPDGAVRGEEILIRPHHLDTNHHVNNGQYVKIAMESLKEIGRVKQLRAEYKKQTYLNDILVPYVSQTETGAYVVELKTKEGEDACVVELQ